ncbi:FecR family protein [Pedobacter sp. AW31-3R]|uniref:FecR family protein n=1 Tax=Pedobacter sp. AW31-3R TaxID=3445781 RepID=UPI003F9FDD94
MQKAEYTGFNVTDFLDNADFVRFIKFQQADDVLFWNTWQSSHPDNLESFKQASFQLRLILSPGHYQVRAGLQDDIFTSIQNTIQQNRVHLKVQRRKYYWMSGLAASLLAGMYGLWFFNSTVTLKAAYGTNVNYTLPDGTAVKLNANSVLTYPRSINWNKVRQVTLNGEAYFKVNHLNKNNRFIRNGDRFVITTSHLLVEVLGTEFNLKDRRNRAEIMLVKGQVNVKSVETGEAYIMKPGNAVQWHRNKLQLKQQVDSLEKTAWLQGKLQVNQTSARDIINEFEDLYGYHVVLTDTAKANKKIDGVISIKSEDSMLFVISHILEVNIKKEGKTIYLTNNGN